MRIASPPSYRRHASGQAFIRVKGKDTYLGIYGSTESVQRYNQQIELWQAEQDKLTAQRQVQLIKHRSSAMSARLAAEAIVVPPDLTIAEAMVEYMLYVNQTYRRPDGTLTHEPNNIRLNFRFLAPFTKELAASFGPLKFKHVIDLMIKHGMVRKQVNHAIGRIKRFFAWLAENERISPTVYHGLLCVKGVRRGRTAAMESEPVKPVEESVVRETLTYLSTPVALMVQFQMLTGCRPGEVCLLRSVDIDRSQSPWIYRPHYHKNSHHGHDRFIMIGPQAQTLLQGLMQSKQPMQYLFSPADAMTAMRTKRRVERRTPISCGNRAGTNRKTTPTKLPATSYSTKSYGSSIKSAIKRANKKREEGGLPPIPHWHPNQIRHAYATEVRRRFGLESAQVCLGHSKADITQTYAERDITRAAQIASEIG